MEINKYYNIGFDIINFTIHKVDVDVYNVTIELFTYRWHGLESGLIQDWSLLKIFKGSLFIHFNILYFFRFKIKYKNKAAKNGN